MAERERLVRLWRARRRHDAIDAVVRRTQRGWSLSFSRNERSLITLEYSTLRQARAKARATLNELQRAGWVDHW